MSNSKPLKSLIRDSIHTLKVKTGLIKADAAFVCIGDKGSYQFRAVEPAAELGLPVIEPWRMPKCRTAILVKSDQGWPELVRSKCDRLIVDLVDAWTFDPFLERTDGRYEGSPEEYWKILYERLHFDDLILCAQSGADSAREHLPDSVQVHCLPHQADSTVGYSYDADGHVAFCGAQVFIESEVEKLSTACSKIGRKFKIDPTQNGLIGAALSLGLRMPPYDTPMNRIAKPQIKLENSAAAGMPVIASNHPCITSTRPECLIVDDNVSDWVEILERGLAHKPLENPITHEMHCEALSKILEL